MHAMVHSQSFFSQVPFVGMEHAVGRAQGFVFPFQKLPHNGPIGYIFMAKNALLLRMCDEVAFAVDHVRVARFPHRDLADQVPNPVQGKARQQDLPVFPIGTETNIWGIRSRCVKKTGPT